MYDDIKTQIKIVETNQKELVDDLHKVLGRIVSNANKYIMEQLAIGLEIDVDSFNETPLVVRSKTDTHPFFSTNPRFGLKVEWQSPIPNIDINRAFLEQNGFDLFQLPLVIHILQEAMGHIRETVESLNLEARIQGIVRQVPKSTIYEDYITEKVIESDLKRLVTLLLKENVDNILFYFVDSLSASLMTDGAACNVEWHANGPVYDFWGENIVESTRKALKYALTTAENCFYRFNTSLFQIDLGKRETDNVVITCYSQQATLRFNKSMLIIMQQGLSASAAGLIDFRIVTVEDQEDLLGPKLD